MKGAKQDRAIDNISPVTGIPSKSFLREGPENKQSKIMKMAPRG
jgi:hypothetical protein